MTTSTTLLIVVVALAALLLVVALAWVARNKRNQHRHAEAETIRDQATEETVHVKRQEALADETAARARAAQAEADVNAAQAAGLEQQAATHRTEATTSRGKLNEQWGRADKLDPAVGAAQKPEESQTSTRKDPLNDPLNR